MTHRSATPRTVPVALLLGLLLLLASALLLPWNLEALSSPAEFGAACTRLWQFVAAFARPSLQPDLLVKGAVLAGETLAVALLGTGLGLLLAWPLALGSSRSVVLGDVAAGERAPWPRRALLEAFRLLLDVLRGVPDFAWAILVANVTGTNAVTGLLALGLAQGGILGKVLSEQWDQLAPDRLAALRSTGAGPLVVFGYGVQPLAARSMLSFVLMRLECAVRNASVIGVVGGGGLGTGLWEEYNDRDPARVATMLLFMLAVTAATDLGANLLRHQLRIDPNHPRARRDPGVTGSTLRRWLGAGLGLGLLLLSLWSLAEPLRFVGDKLVAVEWHWVADYARSVLLQPDLSPQALGSALRESRVPLGIAALATAAAAVAAALLAYPASVAFQLERHRFTGERTGPRLRLLRLSGLVAGRGLGLLLRGIPEVAWVVVLAMFFRIGIAPCVLAVAVHSTGVLLRVFAETVDNVPYRRLEQVGADGGGATFLYGAVPLSFAEWSSYVFFQFEVNLRLGVVLGTVGAGGLGDKFQANLMWREHGRAGTYLWAMVLLTVVVDRTGRWLQLRRNRC